MNMASDDNETMTSDDNKATPETFKTLFDINGTLAISYVTIVLILTLVGVFGNVMILVIMSKEKKINIHARKFIQNIAVADLCVSAIADPMCIAGAFLGAYHLNKDVWLCVAIASTCLTACICVFLNLVALTVNRWMFICHSHLYNRVYNNCTTTIMCVMTWVLAFGAEFPNFLGWSGHFFDEKTHQCIWDRKSSRSYTLFVTLGLITSPFFLLAYCNVAMFYKIWKGKQNIFGLKGMVWSKAISSSKTLLVMFFVFLVCWMPYVIVLIVDTEDSFSFEIHLFVTLLAHSHSSTAFFIYFFVMKSFRDEVTKCFGLKSKIWPMLSSTNIVDAGVTFEGRGATIETDLSSQKAKPPLTTERTVPFLASLPNVDT